MSVENDNFLLESDVKLSLGLPCGEHMSTKPGLKRGFLETIDLNLKRDEVFAAKPPMEKAPVVGWPPVRAFRKNAMKCSCKYVKVAVDGAPYLRKVDLMSYSSYQELLNALNEMFSCLSIWNCLNERKIMFNVNGMEYVPTYEDKDGDWMLVGDVPWKMFVESCNRLRLMKSSEATGLAPRTTSKKSSTS